MTMLSRRKRSSAEEAATEQVEQDQPETDQAETDQTETDQAETEQNDSDKDDAATDTDAADTPATRTRSPRAAHRVRRGVRVRAGVPLLIVLMVVAALLAAGVVGLFIKRAELLATDKAASQAVHAASQAARDLSSYDYRTLESDFKTASNQTTGNLHSEYDALAQQIRGTAIQQQAVSQTTVIKAGVERAAPERVTVLVYANRSAATTASPNRLPETLRIRITMVKVSERWLASDLQVL